MAAPFGYCCNDRRPDALDAPAFLVDQNRRIGIADAVAQGRHQIGDLAGFADIASEQDEAPRTLVREERLSRPG
jgi:hypothetical protein